MSGEADISQASRASTSSKALGTAKCSWWADTKMRWGHTRDEDPQHPRRDEPFKQRMAARAHGGTGWDAAYCSTAPHQP